MILKLKEEISMEVMTGKIKALDRKYETSTGKSVLKITIGDATFLDWKKKVPKEADDWEYARAEYEMKGEYKNLTKIEEHKPSKQETLEDAQKRDEPSTGYGPMSSSTRYLALKCSVELMGNEKMRDDDNWVKRTLDCAEAFEDWLKTGKKE